MLILIDLIFIILFTSVSYISSNNFILAMIILAGSFLYFIFFFNPKFKKYNQKIVRYHECYNFINTYIVSLSVTNSLVQAFERTIVKPSKSLGLELEGVKDLEAVEKLKYLKRYFPFHIYEIFLNIIDLFIEQGGDILKMSNYMLKEARTIEEYIDSCMSFSKRKVVEIIILWLMSFALLIFVRFGLSQFFDALSKQKFYPICIGAFFGFVLIATDISLNKLLNIEIQGYKGYEKAKKIFRKH